MTLIKPPGYYSLKPAADVNGLAPLQGLRRAKTNPRVALSRRESHRGASQRGIRPDAKLSYSG